MDKVYPRFLIRKRRCRCGAPACRQRVWLAFILDQESDRDNPNIKPEIEHPELFVVQDGVRNLLDAESRRFLK